MPIDSRRKASKLSEGMANFSHYVVHIQGCNKTGKLDMTALMELEQV